jgi:hypothetical protein
MAVRRDEQAPNRQGGADWENAGAPSWFRPGGAEQGSATVYFHNMGEGAVEAGERRSQVSVQPIDFEGTPQMNPGPGAGEPISAPALLRGGS